MMETRKSWREKLHKEMGPKVVDTPRGKILVPKPLDVDATMRRVKKGRLVSQRQLRHRLAKDFGTDSACPMTTGIQVAPGPERSESWRIALMVRTRPPQAGLRSRPNLPRGKREEGTGNRE
jgi:hypothetical protein